MNRFSSWGAATCAAVLAFAAISVAHAEDAGREAVSPDGKIRVFIKTEAEKSTAPAGGQRDSLWISEGGRERLLAAPRVGEKAEEQFQSFNNLVFAPDGRSVYVVADAWVTSGAVHRIDLATGKERYITSANDLRVIVSGKYKGDLLVRKHRYYHGGGSYDPLALVSPSGKELLKTVPGAGNDGDPHDDNGRAWLKRNHATAR
ncbi:MAG: hypothetical protein JSR45_03740 [Proteobacteria bacterium]|nr:hypothetical protein [Pseudomonadota bacterium]